VIKNLYSYVGKVENCWMEMQAHCMLTDRHQITMLKTSFQPIKPNQILAIIWQDIDARCFIVVLMFWETGSKYISVSSI
jgi:hypothetical protein